MGLEGIARVGLTSGRVPVLKGRAGVEPNVRTLCTPALVYAPMTLR